MQRMVAVVMALLMAGCSAEKKQEAGNASAPAERSTGALVVDGITGRGAVQAGKRAQQTIEDVSKQKNKDLKDAMGEP
jgi:hypothetical protein